MCEPSHSIVQFPEQDEDGNPTENKIDAIQPPEGTHESFWRKLKRRIGGFFHFSALGFGHSQSLGRLTPAAWRLLPQQTKFEADWWERRVHFDGYYDGFSHHTDPDTQLAAAKQYANQVSIGSLGQLRQFLTTSIRLSEMRSSYFTRFCSMLTEKARDEYIRKMKEFFNFDVRFDRGSPHDGQDPRLVERMTSFMLGYTRKRNLLVPAWADDDALWRPKTTMIVPR